MALGPCKQCFILFSEGLKLSSRSDIQRTWGMAQAGLSSSEPGADLSAWLAKITAQLNGSMAPSWAICITISSANPSGLLLKFARCFCKIKVPYVPVIIIGSSRCMKAIHATNHSISEGSCWLANLHVFCWVQVLDFFVGWYLIAAFIICIVFGVAMSAKSRQNIDFLVNCGPFDQTNLWNISSSGILL